MGNTFRKDQLVESAASRKRRLSASNVTGTVTSRGQGDRSEVSTHASFGKLASRGALGLRFSRL